MLIVHFGNVLVRNVEYEMDFPGTLYDENRLWELLNNPFDLFKVDNKILVLLLKNISSMTVPLGI